MATYEAPGRRRDFLVTATPGSGKTTLALALAIRLLRAELNRLVGLLLPGTVAGMRRSMRSCAALFPGRRRRRPGNDVLAWRRDHLMGPLGG